MNTSKFIGSIMILIGTTVGAGMLQLQTISSPAGFILASILMIFMAFFSIITGLMVIEVNLALPSDACSFSSMTEQTLGNFWKAITWIVYLFLLYSITWAYIAGGASLITIAIESALNIKIPSYVNAAAFTLILGSSVLLGTKTVDYFNRGLISFKGLLLLIALVLILPKININNLIVAHSIEQAKYLWVAAPIFLVSFFYHSVIPSLRIYTGDKPHVLKHIVIFGTIFTLIIYLLWLVATLGTVPLIGNNSFTSLVKNNGSVGEFIQIMTTIINNKWIASSINCFSSVALTTSFLGVTLGLFDFLADGFKISNTRSGRLKTAFLTFVPPLMLAILYPKGFGLALNYASIFVAIIAFILPSLMIYRLRKNPNLKSPYRMFGGNALFALIFLIGIILLALPILSNLNLLPNI